MVKIPRDVVEYQLLFICYPRSNIELEDLWDQINFGQFNYTIGTLFYSNDHKKHYQINLSCKKLDLLTRVLSQYTVTFKRHRSLHLLVSYTHVFKWTVINVKIFNTKCFDVYMSVSLYVSRQRNEQILPKVLEFKGP